MSDTLSKIDKYIAESKSDLSHYIHSEFVKTHKKYMEDNLYRIEKCNDSLYEIIASIDSMASVDLIDVELFRSFDKETMSIIHLLDKLKIRIQKELM